MTSQSTDDLQNIHLYESLLSQHGDSFKSLNWGSRESQIKRFEVLAEVGIKSGDSVLDVGCGLADFYAWLQKHRPGVLYSGIDITPEMIKRARERFSDIHLMVGTILEGPLDSIGYDYVVASGIFYLRQFDPEIYMEKTISSMFYLAKRGVAFNCLSSWIQNPEPGEFYADPLRTLQFCRTLTPYLTLRHDYHKGDFTIHLIKKV
jgi:ubiquinone/menaquinone biosynthesis C-methylase UbiE